MKKVVKISISLIGFLGIAVALLTIFIKNHNIPIMEPKGLIAIQERKLILIASFLMLIVVVPVIVLTLSFAWRYRENNKQAKYTPDWEDNKIAECCWWGIPLVIILILTVITYRTYHSIASDKQPIEIQVVALNWKWLFIYPKQGIASINFCQFPENTPIRFEITADAPMNSFWIPQLGSQIYAMPAMITKLNLMANEIGEYRGCSSSISGKGFAGMLFTAKASTEEEFDQWVQSIKQSPKNLGCTEYNELVKPSEYAPVASYVLMQPDLFDRIVDKYFPSSQ